MMDVISDEIIMYLNVVSLLTAGLSSNIGKEHGALIILKDNIVSDVKYLHLQK